MSKIIYFSQKCLGPCENNRECVQCETFGGKNKNCDCDIKSTIVDRIDDYDNEYKKCQFVDQTDNCTFFFSFNLDFFRFFYTSKLSLMSLFCTMV